jgi:hypothetical protein
MLLVQKIANLLGGVSQRPATQRLASQAETQINALSSVEQGVRRRPPSQHVGKLEPAEDDDALDWTGDAFVHVINRDEDERYQVVVAGGDIQVFDSINKVAVPVISPQGKAYLEDSAGKGFRAVTVGDTTILVNRGVQTAQGTTKSSAAVNEALLVVQQADFSTLYAVTLDGITVSLRTNDQDAPADRKNISTEAISGDLLTLLEADAILSAAFTFVQFGSTIHLKRGDGADFSLKTADGLGDKGLLAIKGSVQEFDDLPSRAPNGFVAEVTGAIDTAKDNFFVKYDDLGLSGQQGVWRECPKPGTLVDLDRSTLPHRLTLRGEGVGELKHQGLPASVGTTSLYLPEPTFQSFDSLVLEGTAPGTAIPGAGFITADGGGCDMVADQDGVRMYFFYDIDISRINFQDSVTISLIVNGTTVDSRVWDKRHVFFPGDPVPDAPEGPTGPLQYLLASNVSTSDVIQVRMNYGLSTSPTGLAYFTFYSGCFGFYDLPGRTVALADEVFPAGSTVTLTLNSDVFEYTVGDADETAADVWTGLKAEVVADTDYDVPVESSANHTFVAVLADGTTEITTWSLVGSFPALTFHSHSLSLTVDELVGNILRDITDGSTGIVTSNTETTITVDSLTGGADDTVGEGDTFSVTIDPGEGNHFVFEPIPWRDRGAGDLDVVPFPSFTGSAISDVFFYQNRLGFLCKENVVLSSAADLFNFFRYTATDLRADDVIDVRSAHAEVTIFDSAFLWNENLYVKSDLVWFRVSGDPALTPSTIRLDPVGRYPSSKDPRPVVIGEKVYFARAKSGNTQVFELSLAVDGTTTQVRNLTKDLPTFIPGKPLEMVGDSAEGFLALLVDSNDQSRLYVRSWHAEQGQDTVESWSYWEFAPGTRLVGLGMADGVLGFVARHTDGAYLEQIDLDLTPDATEKVAYMDRRVGTEVTTSGTLLAGDSADYDVVTDTTTWTLPYSVAVDGSEGDVCVGDRELLVDYLVSRPSPTTVAVTGHGDLTQESVYVGVRYKFTWKPSTLFIRGQSGLPETGGRTQVRQVELFYSHTTDFLVTVGSTGLDDIEYAVTQDEPQAGSLKFAVLSQNIEASIEVTNDSLGPCALSELDWEGWFTSRDKRV